jgi:hypothetical protein
LIAALLLCACAHRAAPPSPAENEVQTPLVHEVPRTVGPARWSKGVIASVPAGWYAEAGPPATVTITDPLTLASVAIYLDSDLPDTRPGMLRLFADEDTWRRVPLLYPGGSETWLSRDPAGPTVLVWYSNVEGHAIHVDLSSPPNELVHALERFQPVLDGLGLP